ncbi:MAG: helix-hairpin-helix domain-containing protein [Dehalococcoidales bacterium]|nr:helix-hairpin-helix domain-containing protein [Dehalococcoidales bacterium]
MELDDRLETLSAAAQFDVCGGREMRPLPSPSSLRFIHRAALPGGGCVSLFKVLLTNSCVNDCGYCVNQVGRDVPRCGFQPDELARMFMDLQQRRLVTGLFLTSGIGQDPSRTMEAMIKVVEILRYRYKFPGYVHLKILPGARFDCVEAGCKLANRVSVNMEAPTVHHLARLSRKKNLHEGILERMRWVKQLMATNDKLVPSGQTTQFVVGAAGEADRDILRATGALYQEIGLRRVYYSAFHPISHSRLENVPPAPPLREHRLYQSDWLLRVYGFAPGEVELALGAEGNLSLRKDPKLVIAQKQPWLFPVDINRASYNDLLRVPGIGPESAKKIIDVRGEHSIDSLQQLRKMRVVTKRAASYIRFHGMLEYEKQSSFLPLLEEEEKPLTLQEILQIEGEGALVC